MMKKILAASWHPGSARAVASVVKRLTSDGKVDVVTIGHEFAEQVFQQKNVAYKDITAYGRKDVSAASMEEVLKNENPQLVLTGFSAQDGKHRDTIEQNLTLAAREAKIPTLGALEYWMPGEYARLVSDIDANNAIERTGRLRYVPEVMAVPDQLAKDAIIAEWKDVIPAQTLEQKIIPTGSPVWDELVDFKEKFSADDRHAVRNDVRVPEDAYLILFMSQPVELQFKDSKGYTEKTVLEDLMRGYAAVKPSDQRKPYLLVKSHPREDQQDLEARFTRLKNEFRVANAGLFTGKYDPLRLIASCDTFASMITTSFIDAVALGKPSLSLQPGLAEQDTVVTNALGLTASITDLGFVGTVLQYLISEPKYHERFSECSRKFQGIDGHASERVANLAYRALAV